MDEKIIYSIKDIAVNPDFVGVIVAPHSGSYIFEDPSEVPEEVRQITGLSAGKIKTNLYLARKNIRNKMNQTDPDL